MYMYCLEYRVSWVRVPPEAAHFSRKSDCLGCAVLLCLVCLFDLLSFFLPPSSFKNMYILYILHTLHPCSHVDSHCAHAIVCVPLCKVSQHDGGYVAWGQGCQPEEGPSSAVRRGSVGERGTVDVEGSVYTQHHTQQPAHHRENGGRR